VIPGRAGTAARERRFNSTQARLLYVGVALTGALSTSLLVPLFVAAGLDKVLAYLAAIPPVTCA
jgi:hypothetical protein